MPWSARPRRKPPVRRRRRRGRKPSPVQPWRGIRGGVAGAVRSGVWRSIEEMEGSSGGGGGGERVDGDGLGVSVTTAAAEDGVELGWTGFAWRLAAAQIPGKIQNRWDVGACWFFYQNKKNFTPITWFNKKSITCVNYKTNFLNLIIVPWFNNMVL